MHECMYTSHFENRKQSEPDFKCVFRFRMLLSFLLPGIATNINSFSHALFKITVSIHIGSTRWLMLL